MPDLKNNSKARSEMRDEQRHTEQVSPEVPTCLGEQGLRTGRKAMLVVLSAGQS